MVPTFTFQRSVMVGDAFLDFLSPTLAAGGGPPGPVSLYNLHFGFVTAFLLHLNTTFYTYNYQTGEFPSLHNKHYQHVQGA